MARAEFEYDEVGNTFYYVLISFYALILIPCTYFFFPWFGKKEERKVDVRECQCEGCQVKRENKEKNKPWQTTTKVIKIVGLVVAWLAFLWLVQKVSSIESTHEEYNPYAILDLDSGADVTEVKKKYRELSKKFHPDRGGDAETFDKLAKAYQALTDDEARENWEKYGNPDGPTATTFGIALPKWLVSKEYGLWVLAFYGLVFMVILPVVVGIWWYNSIKYNVDKVLIDTTQLFYYFLHRTPKMELNRMLMILAGSFEFWKQYNKEIVERETDDVELPRLMKQFSNLGENKKERPLCLPYALKARILIHAYLRRTPLESKALEQDQEYIINRCLRLIEEMISCSQQMSFYSQVKVPFSTMENILRLMPMIVQGLWPKNNPLLQLPHITEHTLFSMRRQAIKSCAQLARLDDAKRRQLLSTLDDYEYRDVLVVLSSMPQLKIDTSFEVQGEDDKHDITAGCLVTLKVTLTRESLLAKDLVGWDDKLRKLEEEGSDAEQEKDDEKEDVEEEKEDKDKDAWKKKKLWDKKGGKKGGNKFMKQKKKPAATPASPTAAGATATEVPATATAEGTSAEGTPAQTPSKKAPKKQSHDDEEASDQESASGSESGDEGTTNAENNDDESDVDDNWKPEKPVFETKTRETHPVHSPEYPGDKYEWWWLTLAFNDKKQKRLCAAVTPVKTLIDTQTIDMRFTAPEQKGVYSFTLGVHSDSYMDADYSVDIKLHVKEAKVVAPVKYEDTEDEDEKANASSSEEYTEDSEDDDE